MASMRSAMTLLRLLNSVPWSAISSAFQPAPTPNRNRPFEIWSILATDLAVWIGSRCGTRQMPVASFSRVVTAAAAPSGVAARPLLVPVEPIVDDSRMHVRAIVRQPRPQIPGHAGEIRDKACGHRDRRELAFVAHVRLPADGIVEPEPHRVTAEPRDRCRRDRL